MNIKLQINKVRKFGLFFNKHISPWREAPLWEDDQVQLKELGLNIYKALPSKIAGLMQVYGKPMIYKINLKNHKRRFL